MVSRPEDPPLRSSPACERNQAAIRSVLEDWVVDNGVLLEIGSGTGQHAAYSIDLFTHLVWQPSDRVPDHKSIAGWASTSSDPARIRRALTLDVSDEQAWANAPRFQTLLTVNTLHIMSWEHVQQLFYHSAAIADANGRLLVYGPFHENGGPTSEGNAVFDNQLRAEGGGMGIRDIESVRATAAANDWLERAHYQMPANNQMLVFGRPGLSD